MIQPTTKISQDSMESRMMRELHAAIDDKLKKVTDQIVADAKQDFEIELRAAIGAVVVNLATYYSVERCGPDLVIHVKLEGTK